VSCVFRINVSEAGSEKPKFQFYMKALINKMSLIYKVNRAILKNRIPIFLQYDMRVKARYGQGKPYGNGKNVNPKLREIISKYKTLYKANLLHILSYSKYFEKIPLDSTGTNPEQPCWLNGYIPGLDAITLYGFIASYEPRIYLEVGSGNSTKFAHEAIRDMGLSTKIISIDPFPRTEIDGICDEVIRSRLEDVNVGLFDSLGRNDILFIDSSHYVFPNSDVTAIFLDILPRLKSGVLVHFHDIFLPFDYPNEQVKEYYSEQYILAAYLLAEGNKTEIIQANTFISNEDELHSLTIPLWTNIGLVDHFVSGCSFWIKMK
jgi:hypothetical protein